MKTEVKDVKLTKDGVKQVVGQVEMTIYENIDELVAEEDGAVIVAKFNKANKIDVMNAERVKHAERKLGKLKKIQMAYNVVTPEELLAVAGDYGKLEELLLSEEVQSRIS